MRSVSEPERVLSLTIVATPIGNLKDLSARALEVLNSVDYILCEDTRRAQKLKTHFAFNPRLVSFHEHNERSRIPAVLSRMKRGKTFALISDAGTPLISDPGLQLVQEMIRENLQFSFVPGPSAVQSALVMSGFRTYPYYFYGFLPVKPGDRTAAIEQISMLRDCTIVLFESPKRILGLVREVGEKLGDRPIAVCRELTKLHEEVIRGNVSEILDRLASRKLLGEFTLVISPGQAGPAVMTVESIRARFDHLQNEGLSRKEALKKLSKESGRPKNELYELLMK